MKLNLGAGTPKTALPAVTAGWCYVDLHGWPTHVRADALVLPFRDGSMEAVHCAHLLEHVSQTEAHILLGEIRRVLALNGYAYISTPDAGRTRAIKSEYWSTLTRWGAFARGWRHQWQPTVSTLRRMLVECGFEPSWATAVPSGHPPNSHGWPVDLEARFVCRRDDFKWPKHFPVGVLHI